MYSIHFERFTNLPHVRPRSTPSMRTELFLANFPILLKGSTASSPLLRRFFGALLRSLLVRKELGFSKINKSPTLHLSQAKGRSHFSYPQTEARKCCYNTLHANIQKSNELAPVCRHDSYYCVVSLFLVLLIRRVAADAVLPNSLLQHVETYAVYAY